MAACPAACYSSGHDFHQLEARTRSDAFAARDRDGRGSMSDDAEGVAGAGEFPSDTLNDAGGKRPATGDRLASRRKREADALRANLRKRKDQARAREKPKQE
jgi:hypothetical protein